MIIKFELYLEHPREWMIKPRYSDCSRVYYFGWLIFGLTVYAT